MDLFPALPENRVMPWVRLRRDRVMDVGGEVIAAIGRRVDPLDLVARARPPKETRAIPLGRVMGLREQDIPRHLLKHVGDTLEARDVIISKRINIFNEHLIYRAPVAGRIAAIQGSWMLLDLDVDQVQVLALYRGLVVNVSPRRGVTIECEGAWAQGIWGSGQEGYGVLKLAVKEPNAALGMDQIDVTVRGMVLAAGTVTTRETLVELAKAHIAGLIVGSLPPALFGEAADLGLPVIVTEGVGEAGLCPPLFELVRQFQGNEAVINASAGPQARSGLPRPELFIPLIKEAGQPDALPPVPLTNQVGARVRVTREPGLGQTGLIVSAADRARPLETGARATGAIVELAAGRVFVPWTNLELVG